MDIRTYYKNSQNCALHVPTGPAPPATGDKCHVVMTLGHPHLDTCVKDRPLLCQSPYWDDHVSSVVLFVVQLCVGVPIFPTQQQNKIIFECWCASVQVLFSVLFITKQRTLNVNFLWQDGFIDRVSEKQAQSSLELYMHIAIKSAKKSNKHGGKQVFYLKLCKKTKQTTQRSALQISLEQVVLWDNKPKYWKAGSLHQIVFFESR